MKKFCKLMVLLGALALGTNIASASGITESIHVDVPFSFVVAGKVFPAGQYLVQESDGGIILIRGEGAAAIVLSIPSGFAKADKLPALHFTTNNGQEYLVAIDGQNSSRAIPVHASETRTLTLSH
jgi:hypothetical protein